MSMLRADGFRVELDPENLFFNVLYSHYLIVLRPCRYFETIRQNSRVDHQRMVACSPKRVAQTREQVLSVVPDHGGFPMHKDAGVHNSAAEGLTHTLVAKTNSQDGNAATEAPDYIY